MNALNMSLKRLITAVFPLMVIGFSKAAYSLKYESYILRHHSGVLCIVNTSSYFLNNKLVNKNLAHPTRKGFLKSIETLLKQIKIQFKCVLVRLFVLQKKKL